MAAPDTVETYNELETFDNEYAPQSGRRPGLDTLADGDYDFSIQDAELSRTQKDKELILKLGLRVESSLVEMGKVVEKAYFFRSQTSVDILGSDLCTLGFDSDRWKPEFGRKFSQELPPVIPKLVGMRFRGKKTSKVEAKKTHHNLYINAKLAGDSIPSVSPSVPVGGMAQADTIPF